MLKWDPKDYEKNSTAQGKWAGDALAKIKLRGDERILDIGCGDGKITAELAKKVPSGSVVGLDVSEEMIRFAGDKYKDCSNLSFQRGDASCLLYKNEFDYVVSFSCLHWVKDHLPVLAGIHRSLRSAGRVLLQFGGIGNAAEVFSAFDEILKSGEWQRYFKEFENPYNFCRPEDYRTLLQSAGLKEDRLEVVPKDMVQPGKKELAGWIRTTWHPYLERVPSELREKFIDQIVDVCVRRNPPGADGSIHIPMVRLEVEASVPA